MKKFTCSEVSSPTQVATHKALYWSQLFVMYLAIHDLRNITLLA